MLVKTRISLCFLTSILVAHSVQAQTTTRVSVGTGGAQAMFGSFAPVISGDGKVVAFESATPDLVAADLNGARDIFVRHREGGTTALASVSSSGGQGDYDSYYGSVSADGRYVAFESEADDLIAGDTNHGNDAFVYDRQTGQTVRVSVSSSGAQGNKDSGTPSISADGRFVAFQSDAKNLVAGDTNARGDIFVHDMVTGQTVRASVDSNGVQGNDVSDQPAISADGTRVAFRSRATNLAPGDTNLTLDVFVHDLSSGQTTLVSVDSAGVQANSLSQQPAISANGNAVAFVSGATNLGSPASGGVFLHDLVSGQTTVVSVSPTGAFLVGIDPAISADGRFVVYSSVQLYVRDVQAGLTTLVSVSTNGGPSNGGGSHPSISADGSSIAFQSYSTNLVPGDTNGASDVFVRDWWQPCYVDGDLDGFGAGAQIDSPVPCGAGFASNASDCDDSLASVHPGAVEQCNGIDDDCDGAIDEGFLSSYCTAGTTSYGCVPSIAGEGAPSSSAASGFDIVVHSVEGERAGLIFYGSNPAALPWGPLSSSFLCVASPSQRTPLQNSGGAATACTGELRVDFNQWIHAHPLSLGNPFVAGQVFYAQGWFRDSGAPKGTNLSDGLRFTLCN